MKKPLLFRWQYGRQRSGYRVFCFWNWLSCDGYIIHIPPGTTILPHTDVVDGKRHFRLNIDLWGRCRMLIDKHLWQFWRFTLFRPDVYRHSVLPSTQSVWLLSLGTAIKGNRGT